jgi:hypothetical protein
MTINTTYGVVRRKVEVRAVKSESDKVSRTEKSKAITSRIETLFLTGYSELEIYALRKQLRLSGKQAHRYLARTKEKMLGGSDQNFEKALLYRRVEHLYREAIRKQDYATALECLKMKIARCE